jgi:membrane protease YdiL (CAAX protease family)
MVIGSVALLVAAVFARAHGLDPEGISKVAVDFVKSAPGILASAAVSEGSFLAVAIVTATLLERNVVKGLRLGPTRARPLGYLAAVVGTAGLSVATGSAADLLRMRSETGTMEMIAASLTQATPVILVLAILMIGVGPGIAEEAFFRGLMQTRLAARLGRWPAILVTAACFGLIHLDRVQSPLAFVLGIFLGWSAETLGGIRPSMVAHAVNNAIFVTAACLGDSDPTHANTRGENLAAIAVGGVLFLGAAALLRSPLGVKSEAR